MSMEAILPPVAASLAEARRMVTDGAEAPVEVVEDALLVLTELLANEIKHGRYAPSDPLICSVRTADDTVRIEVRHSGGDFEMPTKQVDLPLQARETGWGLALITRLADRWGVEETRGARQVWAEIDVRRSA
jgi:anti-sigma regulatory factor (Ser/Thr protein kinase)